VHERRRADRPLPWDRHRAQVAAKRLRPFHHIEWCLSWAAWALGNWVFLDVLEHLGTFSVLIAVIFYFADSHNRVKQRHYQAWQVINTAQGKGGSGGRVEALEQLNNDSISLVGVDVSGAFLRGVSLPNARLSRCDLHAADLRDSNLANARMDFCNMANANFRSANLTNTQLEDADLQGADLHSATLRNAALGRSDLSGADLRDADLTAITWTGVQSIKLANIAGVRNAPPEFVTFALAHGAVSIDSDDQWNALLQADTK